MAPKVASAFKPLLVLLSVSAIARGAPPVINDSALLASFQKGVGAFAGKDGIPSADDLAKSSAGEIAPGGKLDVPAARAAGDHYNELSKSVFLVGSVYKCEKCDHWHSGGIATAWCLSEDGLMVTNAHVFAKAKGAGMGICDRDGKCYPVTEVLAADPHADIALFRVDGEGFQPLALGTAAEVGTDVSVISNPDRHYFTRTSGEVSRYCQTPAHGDKKATTWMSITADYARGSSGGPVFNPAGEVVGMVATTQTIYYGSDKANDQGPVQMVVKNCVPVDAIRRLLAPE
ncbi:S1 family peptidase [Luteolibacter marinus]|uniref:S1 family peptidase n=1 Tax=Luteolibacter marinus TaxID=2776705 RepID=UPI001866CCD8|nr:serine protease [Luteolibacter marinus]